MAVKAIPIELLRRRWPGPAVAFDEICRKRRRIPAESDAAALALALVLRGTERERFMAAAREGREASGCSRTGQPTFAVRQAVLQMRRQQTFQTIS